MLLLSIFVRGEALYWPTMRWLRMAVWGARVICGVNYRVHGLERLPTQADRLSAVVLAAKHQSTWETFAYPTLMPHPLAYVFKRELLYVPFFGWAMGRLDMIHIDRSKRAEAWNKVAAQGKRLAAEGIWVIMFPEGTRTPRGSQGSYKSGASRLAIATGVPIVPIAASSAKCWPRKSFLLRPGVIDVSIGQPIASSGREPEELMREVEAWIEAEMRRLDPEAYAAQSVAA
jgi:1-acyl-sn-glycerol-3-phosphate acyltransferase